MKFLKIFFFIFTEKMFCHNFITKLINVCLTTEIFWWDETCKMRQKKNAEKKCLYLANVYKNVTSSELSTIQNSIPLSLKTNRFPRFKKAFITQKLLFVPCFFLIKLNIKMFTWEYIIIKKAIYHVEKIDRYIVLLFYIF